MNVDDLNKVLPLVLLHMGSRKAIFGEVAMLQETLGEMSAQSLYGMRATVICLYSNLNKAIEEKQNLRPQLVLSKREI